jgi:hypothetical protein
MEETCGCGEKGMFLHSGCCCAHFEGVILKTGDNIIVCEKCGKYVGHIQIKKEFHNKKYWLGG